MPTDDSRDDGGPARAAMIAGAMALVDAMARERAGRGVDVEDLRSAGYQGLCEAAGLYDPAHPSKASFGAYASWHVRKRMGELILEARGGVIHVPRRNLYPAPRPAPAPLDEFCAADPGPEAVDRDEMVDLAAAALASCPEPGRTVLAWHCGLEGEGPLSIREAARRLGMTPWFAGKALDDACLAVAEYIRARGWTAEGWAEAISS